MAAIFSDQEIYHLIQERKPLPDDYRTKIQIRPKLGHKERELDIKGADGGDYRLILRQSIFNPLDFSIILAYRPPKSNQLFRLQRYNDIMGKAMNILTLSKGKHFMIFTFTRRQKSIRRLVPEKTPLLNQRTDLLIFSRPLHVYS